MNKQNQLFKVLIYLITQKIAVENIKTKYEAKIHEAGQLDVNYTPEQVNITLIIYCFYFQISLITTIIMKPCTQKIQVY